MTLLLSLSGLFTAAFFLSRTYVIVPYLLAALVVAEYSVASTALPDLPKFRIGRDALRVVLTACVAIVALFMITRVLL
jgi:hypothetical protein